MLKIKDNSKINDILEKYGFDYEADSDYEEGWSYAIYMKDGVVLDVSNTGYDENADVFIYGIDDTKLDILYDLIKADLVEKVEDNESN